MTRNVRKIGVLLSKQEPAQARPFSEFADATNLILLGEPGSGKSHLFSETAASEGATFLKARAFLARPAKTLSGQALFIDGLDERRAGRGDLDTIDAMVKQLFEVQPSRVRVSCRIADWLGETDLTALNTYFGQSSEPIILLLETLSEVEQVAVLSAQGAQGTEAFEFLAEARHRGLDDFLTNPQNLIMLWGVAKGGSWPANRRELFELSTRLMLKETNAERARSGVGSYSVEELRAAAGAIFAASLISDVEAVSLTDQEGTADVPGYRSVPFAGHEILQAAMSRRVFVAGPVPESVGYAHRTTAEYLGAEFLADRIHNGLALTRVTSLMGVDRHPAPELRGLHAWLAVHLSDRADELIDADPYGVLTYGDAASLPPSACRALIRALADLSKTDPWFRSEHGRSPAIGALARPDMVDELRAVLANLDAGFGARSIVIDAFWLGAPAPEAIPELAAAFADELLPYVPRLHALYALGRLGDAGKQAATQAFAGLGHSMNGLRLRADSILQFFGDPLGPSDVIALVANALSLADLPATGIFWTFADKLPLHDLPAILDGIQVPKHQGGYHKGRWEVGAFYWRILKRAWIGRTHFNPQQTLEWLYKNRSLNKDRGDSRTSELRAALLATPERLHALADHFLLTLDADDDSWRRFLRFGEATLHTLSPITMLEMVLKHMELADAGSPKQLFLYDTAFQVAYQAPVSDSLEVFEKLCDLADSGDGFRQVAARRTSNTLHEGYLDYKANRPASAKVDFEQQRRDFDCDEAQIRIAGHLGWITHIAKIYFAEYAEVDRSISPHQRLAAWLGESRVQACVEGLRATLSREPLPSFKEALELVSRNKHFAWWHGFVAGLNERWKNQPDFDGLSADFLQTLVAFDLTKPVWTVEDAQENIVTHPWLSALLDAQPKLVSEVYIAIAQERLSKKEEYVQGLNELMTEEHFAQERSKIAIRLLSDFPSPTLFQLGQMLDAALSDPAVHRDLLPLAQNVISQTTSVGNDQYDQWLATGYLLSPAEYAQLLKDRVQKAAGVVFALRDRGGLALGASAGSTALPLEILQFMVEVIGEFYPETPIPSGGTSGDKSPWDVSEYVRSLINAISIRPTQEATNTLNRLRDTPALSTYKLQLLYAIANQAKLRRAAEYDRPDWAHTLDALNKGPPATVADLHAMTVEHIRDLRDRIERENTDIYKQFWNLNGVDPESPRVEDLCRDYLVTLLRNELKGLGIIVEPEGHMVADKRADISVAMPGRKVLCELKRSHHDKVWSAATEQLDRFYVHDPEAKGFGIYVVFWFAAKDPWKAPPPPNGQTQPASALQMERMLIASLPDAMKGRVAVIVIDVSGPAYKKVIKD
jgi:predicted NACHT family NTPase